MAVLRLTCGQRRINAALARPAHTVNGWATNLHLGTYGHDAGLRAVVAASGWAANVPREAVYAHVGDATRTPYRGTQQYVLHFARDGLPPVKAFWSVTMYGPDRFFVANPIDRYAIGDRTQGVHYGKDGSLDVFVQHDPPAGHESNWLPAPSGAFYLSMRLYLPKAKVLAGHYRFPKLTVRRGA